MNDAQNEISFELDNTPKMYRTFGSKNLFQHCV